MRNTNKTSNILKLDRRQFLIAGTALGMSATAGADDAGAPAKHEAENWLARTPARRRAEGTDATLTSSARKRSSPGVRFEDEGTATATQGRGRACAG